jgi:hypothetical protein
VKTSIRSPISLSFIADSSDCAGLVEVILMMRADRLKIRTDFSDLKRAMTPKRPDRGCDFPISLGCSPYAIKAERRKYWRKNTPGPI